VPKIDLVADSDGKVVPTAQRYFLSACEHIDRGNVGGAEHCLISALRLDPNHPGALSRLSGIAGERRQWSAALALAQRAANIAPEEPSYIANLGVAMIYCEQYGNASRLLMEAIKLAEKRLAEHGDVMLDGLAKIYHQLGIARSGAGRPEQAAECFARGMQLAPNEERIRRDFGIAKLACGDYGVGLIAHESRWSDLYHFPIWDSGIPRWHGQDIDGKTIVVHHEQGFGDTIQFARFLPWLRGRGARVVCAVTQPLMRLMALSGLADEVVEISGEMPPADFHSPMLSVPAHLGLTLDNIPCAPYLRAPEALPGIPIKRHPGVKLNVGIVWAGSAGYVPDLRRSMQLEALLRLADIPQINLISFQKGDRAGDIVRAGASGIVADVTGILGDFADTAAALMQVDLFVSVDTAPLHLAGALGRPCIAMLPYWRCWRWLVDREDTPWYPTMTLVTQEEPGDWAGVVNRVRDMILEAEIEEEVTIVGKTEIAA
jgi:Glycosyltransferase family 9 (heptosyltransferase)/Tetratricopeptide repeat